VPPLLLQAALLVLLQALQQHPLVAAQA